MMTKRRRFGEGFKAHVAVEALPAEPNTAAGKGERRALWLGPDQWLVVTPSGAEGRAVIGLAGAHARDVLAKGCPLDLHPRAFGPGRCAQSTLAKALVILHQLSDRPSYDIYVERSFADYLWTWLEDAAAEHGVAITKG